MKKRAGKGALNRSAFCACEVNHDHRDGRALASEGECGGTLHGWMRLSSGRVLKDVTVSDGMNMLEFLSMLSDAPQPELGLIRWVVGAKAVDPINFSVPVSRS